MKAEGADGETVRALVVCGGRRAVVFVLPGLWVLGVVAWELCRPTGGRLLRAVEPAAGVGTRVMTCGAILAVIGAGCLTAGRRLRLVRELERTREVAVAAQRVVLRPLPRRVDGVLLAADHLSASEGAMVGGDLYEVVATRHGVRAVIGDVRGHGLQAIGTVAAMLGSFREVAHDEPELGEVLRRLERAHRRHLRERALVERPAAGEGDPVSAFAVGGGRGWSGVVGGGRGGAGGAAAACGRAPHR
ncbi:SpoIIE family protein phosphatase [Streptomyces lydicus]|uniref:SpoIIE family protein phosphatase n=1 Tax=Streptomyces lydicus TaxID=47763 RepID=UPI00322014BA